jgi:hypothetical protein
MRLNFDLAYNEFIRKHERQKRGEALRRLKEGHGHAESLFLELVSWPAFGSLDLLIPEYEINDFKDGTRYLDFALISDNLRLAIEIDPIIAPHLTAQIHNKILPQPIRLMGGF